MAGEVPTPRWLASDVLLGQFGKRRSEAQRRYRQFVLEGIGGTTPWAALRQQIYLVDERFVERTQRKAEIQSDELSIPRAQRRAPVLSLARSPNTSNYILRPSAGLSEHGCYNARTDPI